MTLKSMNGNSKPGIYSYFVGTGEPSWFYEVQPKCNDERSERLRRCESSLDSLRRHCLLTGPLSPAGSMDDYSYSIQSQVNLFMSTIQSEITKLLMALRDMAVQLIVTLFQQGRVWFLLDQVTGSFVRYRATCFWHLSLLNDAWLVLNWVRRDI